jgi:hypothetical protein
VSQTSLQRPIEHVAAFFARSPSPQEIAAFHLSDDVLAHVRELLLKNTAGTLTADETRELDELVLLDKMVNLIRSSCFDSTTRSE